MGEFRLLIMQYLNVKLIFLLLVLLYCVGFYERQVNFIRENIYMIKVSRVSETAIIVRKAEI